MKKTATTTTDKKNPGSTLYQSWKKQEIKRKNSNFKVKDTTTKTCKKKTS